MNDRHHKVDSLIRELAAAFIQEEANPDPMITVTYAKSSPDYRQCTVYVTTIPAGREEDVLAFLKRHGGALRQRIKKKSDLKVIPHIDFAIDAGERHRQHIDKVARDVEREKSD